MAAAPPFERARWCEGKADLSDLRLSAVVGTVKAALTDCMGATEDGVPTFPDLSTSTSQFQSRETAWVFAQYLLYVIFEHLSGGEDVLTEEAVTRAFDAITSPPAKPVAASPDDLVKAKSLLGKMVVETKNDGTTMVIRHGGHSIAVPVHANGFVSEIILKAVAMRGFMDKQEVQSSPSLSWIPLIADAVRDVTPVARPLGIQNSGYMCYAISLIQMMRACSWSEVEWEDLTKCKVDAAHEADAEEARRLLRCGVMDYLTCDNIDVPHGLAKRFFPGEDHAQQDIGELLPLLTGWDVVCNATITFDDPVKEPDYNVHIDALTRRALTLSPSLTPTHIINLSVSAFDRAKGTGSKNDWSSKVDIKDDIGKTHILVAIVVHMGPSLHSGHYTCICRYGDVWFFCNDDRPVKDLSAKTAVEAIKEIGPGWTPYLLAYRDRARLPLAHQRTVISAPRRGNPPPDSTSAPVAPAPATISDESQRFSDEYNEHIAKVCLMNSEGQSNKLVDLLRRIKSHDTMRYSIQHITQDVMKRENAAKMIETTSIRGTTPLDASTKKKLAQIQACVAYVKRSVTQAWNDGVYVMPSGVSSSLSDLKKDLTTTAGLPKEVAFSLWLYAQLATDTVAAKAFQGPTSIAHPTLATDAEIRAIKNKLQLGIRVRQYCSEPVIPDNIKRAIEHAYATVTGKTDDFPTIAKMMCNH